MDMKKILFLLFLSNVLIAQTPRFITEVSENQGNGSALHTFQKSANEYISIINFDNIRDTLTQTKIISIDSNGIVRTLKTFSYPNMRFQGMRLLQDGNHYILGTILEKNYAQRDTAYILVQKLDALFNPIDSFKAMISTTRITTHGTFHIKKINNYYYFLGLTFNTANWRLKLSENFRYADFQLGNFVHYPFNVGIDCGGNIDRFEYIPNSPNIVTNCVGTLLMTDTNYTASNAYIFRPTNYPSSRFISGWKTTLRYWKNNQVLMSGSTEDTTGGKNLFFSVVNLNQSGRELNFLHYQEISIPFGWDLLCEVQNLDITRDSSIYFGGTVNWLTNTTNSWVLRKLDANFQQLWTREYGNDAYYFMQGLFATADGGCLMYGQRHNPDVFAPRTAYYLKINSAGQVTATSEVPLSEYAKIKAFPNPTNEVLNIDFTDFSISEKIDIYLFDSFGRCVFKDVTTEKQVQVNTSNLANGQYIIKATNEKGTTRTQKVQILH